MFGHGRLPGQQASQQPALLAALQQSPGGCIQGDGVHPVTGPFLERQPARSTQLADRLPAVQGHLPERQHGVAALEQQQIAGWVQHQLLPLGRGKGGEPLGRPAP